MEKKEFGYYILVSKKILLMFTIGTEATTHGVTKKHDILGTLKGFSITQEDPIKGYILNEGSWKYFGPKDEVLHPNETKHLNETITYNDASLHIVYDLNRLEIYVNGEVEVGGNVSNTPNEYETRIKRHLGIPRVKRV